MKIGDKLYKYATFCDVLKYEIIAIKTTTNLILYEIECKSCNHEPNCTLYITSNNKENNSYRFVSMTNCDSETKEYQCYHDGEDLFFLNKFQARKGRYLKYISEHEKNIVELEKKISFEKKQLNEFRQHLKNACGEVKK